MNIYKLYKYTLINLYNGQSVYIFLILNCIDIHYDIN